MSAAITKAYKAINGLNDLNYILDRRNDGAGRVALKRFFFFDNSSNAYRAIAGRDVKKIDKDKLQGELKLTKLRRFEQVWHKYGTACVSNKNDTKVKEIVSSLQNLMKDIGDINDLKAIVAVNQKDQNAYKTLDTAIRLLEEDTVTRDEINLKRVAFTETITILRNQIKEFEKTLDSVKKRFSDNDLNDIDIDKFKADYEEYESAIKQYDTYLKKNVGVLTKSVIAKHQAFLEQKERNLESNRKICANFLKLYKAYNDFKLAQRALSTVSLELGDKIKERNKWDLPEKYAKLSIEDLKRHAHRIEKALKDHAEIDDESYENKNQIRQDRSNLQHELLSLKEFTSEKFISNRLELDKQVARLQKERDVLLRAKNSLENQYIQLKTPPIKK